MGKPLPWNAHEDSRLVEMYVAGELTQNIANTLGRSRQAVQQRACMLRFKGVRLPSRTAPRDPDVAALNKIVDGAQ